MSSLFEEETRMTIQSQILTFIPRDYEIFSGLDVDKRSIVVTFCDHGELMQSLRLPYSSEQLLNYVRKHFPGQRVAFVYEAGPTGFGLHDELVAESHPCLVVAPSMVPTAPGQRVKTNRLDSRKLSVSLRGGELRSIHVPSPRYRDLRHLVQLRDTHVQQLTATKCRIKALLLYEGIPFPSDEGKQKQWSAQVLDELLELPPIHEWKKRSNARHQRRAQNLDDKRITGSAPAACRYPAPNAQPTLT